MIFRYHILIEYVGTSFIGWQSQPKGKSVQKTIENSLKKILKEKISVVGQGRLDAGVHAISQSAHFDTEKKIFDVKKFHNRLNFILNKSSISILSIKKKNEKFHSRYSAKARVYQYIIFNRESVPTINKNRGWHIKKKINLDDIKKGARFLIGKRDFSTFRSSSCSAKSPIRTLEKVNISKKKNQISIEFKSRSFLQTQVRSMVGCLKYLGEGKWNFKKFKEVTLSKKRILCAPPAPPHGLFLKKVIY
ncbi:tRNA pseudouridine(38-40) synthase TruA [Candidatus Pelagibacter sp.]|nr:tRNA pseudouridine(38-40) synthase TruA [Candidatus Pelagibacter sp.]